MTKGIITIKSDVDEKVLMESLLNQHYSGYFVQPILMIYALANRWNVDKFSYYFKMLGGLKN